MKKFTFFLVLFLLLFSTLVFAQDEEAQQVFIKNGDARDLVIVCTNGGNICDNTVTANITITAPNSIKIVSNQKMTADGNGNFNYTINSSQTATNGDYLVVPFFTNGTASFTKSLIFTVTPSGTLPSIQEALIYIVMFIFVAFITIMTFAWAMNIEGANQYDDMTKTLIDLNYGKYGRILLFGLSYTGLIVLAWLAWMISANILWLSFATNILKVGFLILTRVTYPLLFFIGIVIMARFINHDLKEKRLKNQGLGREHY